jgi:mono/diheme cytochrome c family protein
VSGTHAPMIRGLRLLALLTVLLATCAVASADGGDIFNSHCLVCHQADGKGVPGMYPPLADSVGSYVTVPEGRAYLVHVVSFGMTGAISAHGQTYDGVMQSWPALTDEEVAEVLNYVLANFNATLLPKNFAPLTADEVKKYRTANLALGGVHKERDALMKALATH